MSKPFKSFETGLQAVHKICVAEGIPQENIVLFGSRGSPGVSDLDVLILGTSEQLFMVQREIDALRARNALMRFLLIHDPLYIVYEAIPLVLGFHTLRGLNSTWEERLKSQADPQAIVASKALSTGWFLFLIGVASEYLSQNKPDIRSGLLLLKNLEETVLRLSPNEKTMSDALRQKYAEGHDLLVPQAVERSLIRASGLMCSFLEESSWLSESPPNPWLIKTNRRLVLAQGHTSNHRVFHLGKLAVLSSHPLFLRFVFEMTQVQSAKTHPVRAYGAILRQVGQIYSKTGLRRPYISPFQLF